MGKKLSLVCICFLLFASPVFANNGQPVSLSEASPIAENPSKEKTTPVSATIKDGKISMSFTGAPVGYVLQSLGRLCSVNFGISNTASAIPINLELKDVTFEEALRIISASSGVRIDNTMPGFYVVRAEGEKDGGQMLSQREMEIRSAEDRFAQSFVETVVVRFTSVEDIKNAMTQIIGEENKNLVSISALGSEGDGIGGRQYNTIVIYAANQSIMDRILALVKNLDVPRPMVEVEALFVEVSDNTSKNVGISWTILKEPLAFTNTNPMRGNRWNVSEWITEMNAQASQGSGKTRILAAPKLRVMSGKTASFWSETQIPILNENNDGEVRTEYKNVGVRLEMLPVVLDDRTISLLIRPRSSSVSGIVRLKETEAPQITEQSAETSLLLHPNDVMVIGGLLNSRDIRSSSKFPILHQLPLIGELFKSDTTRREHSSLSVYLRLRLVEDFTNVDYGVAHNIPANALHDVKVHPTPKEITQVIPAKTASALPKEPAKTGGLSEESLAALDAWRSELFGGESGKSGQVVLNDPIYQLAPSAPVVPSAPPVQPNPANQTPEDKPDDAPPMF